MSYWVRVLAVFAASFIMLGARADVSRADTRVALVIGNGSYRDAPKLPNTANDATDVGAALRGSGFQTIVATDLDKRGMDDALIQFARAARTADVAMFYYSGHALQFAGVNYLVPVDASLADEADLRRMTKLDEVVADLAQAKNLRILVLDACRDNPLADQLRRSIGTTRSLPLQRGLAKIDSPQGMIVAYATQAGRTAEDGDGRNSPYTAAFLKHIDEKEEIGAIFRRVSTEVYESTKQTQLPELSLSLIGEFYLNGKVELRPKPEDTIRRDFEAAERVNTIVGWNAFLEQYPSGYFATLAQERRAFLARQTPQPSGTGPRKVFPEAGAPSAIYPLQMAPNATQARAILYDEDLSNPKGKEFRGTVIWRTETIKATGTQKPDLSVRADLEIPERKFKMTMSFRRNLDPTLPASHTAELTFILPPDFQGGGIGNVPGILLKSNEQARGTPLAGLAVKVTEGFFLVGLSNTDTDRSRNIQLLKERGWFDVPVFYNNKRRGILAIEKGTSGERAFNEALEAWGQTPKPASSLLMEVPQARQ